MISEQDRERIHDYLDGRLAPAQAEAFQRRLASDVELATEVATMERLVSQLTTLREERAPPGFSRDVIARLKTTPRAGPRLPRWLVLALPAAAAILFAAIFAHRMPRPETLVAQDVSRQVPPAARAETSIEKSAATAVEAPDSPAEGSAAGGVAPADDDLAAGPDREAGVNRGEVAEADGASGDDRAGAVAPASNRTAADDRTALEAKGRATLPPPTLVWRVRRAPVAEGAVRPTSGKSDTAAADDRFVPTGDGEIPRELLDAIAAIRTESPGRVVERELDAAGRATFLAQAARDGFVVLQLEGASGAQYKDGSAAEQRKLDDLADLDARGTWRELAHDARPGGGGGGGIDAAKPEGPMRVGTAKSREGAPGPQNPATPGAAPAAGQGAPSVGGGSAAGEKKDKLKPMARGEPGLAKDAAVRILIVYEDDIPPK